MTKLHYPDRTYLLSDTFGGHKGRDPLAALDIDARIVTDIRCGFERQGDTFDIFGVEKITDHIVRAVLRVQLEEYAKHGPDAGTTGIFINSAPRMGRGNGQPFYLARLDSGVSVAATPVEALSCVKKDVRELWHLPNKGNGLYGDDEQFRSSFTPRLLAANHGLKLVEDDPATVIPDPQGGCHVSYVDRFGNVVLYGGDWGETQGQNIVLTFADAQGDLFDGLGQEVSYGGSLGACEPGKLVWYGNDGSLEVVRKWCEYWGASERLEQSAYMQLGQPAIGTPVIFSTQKEEQKMRRAIEKTCETSTQQYLLLVEQR